VRFTLWLLLLLVTFRLGSTTLAGRDSAPRIEIKETEPTVAVSIPRYSLTPLERETIAACLILEAASQGDFGMRGVMSVIRNRSRQLPELFAPTVLRPKQFSALNDVTSGRKPLRDAVQRATRDRMWKVALQIVDEASREPWHDSTQGATHYTRSSEQIYWTRSLARTVTIGAHAFYR
jgi:spore germination cell wall hydrolase CwlJ-like protein